MNPAHPEMYYIYLLKKAKLEKSLGGAG